LRGKLGKILPPKTFLSKLSENFDHVMCFFDGLRDFHRNCGWLLKIEFGTGENESENIFQRVRGNSGRVKGEN